MAVTLLQICEKQRFTILMLILSMIMCIQYLVSICLFVLKILSKNQILKSIKGRYSVENLRKTMIYITNVDLVNDYVYTKFGLNRSIYFQDKNSILTLIKGSNSIANLPNLNSSKRSCMASLPARMKKIKIENEGARLFTRIFSL